MPGNSRRGGAIAGVLAVIFVVGLVGIAALVGTGVYVAHHITVTEKDAHGNATVETPFGDIHVRESHLDPAAMGVPLYPGAIRDNDSRKLASFHFDFGAMHKSFAVAAAAYHTRDSVESVTDFYRSQLPHWLISRRSGGGMELSMTKGGYRRMVSICDDDGETRIGLASMGEPASN